MIHKYRFGGKNIVLDINSGAIHTVDDITYSILDIMESSARMPEEEIVRLMKGYPAEDIKEAHTEINELIDKGLLFSADAFNNSPPPKTPVIKALCLHIAHDCNLKCKYCFAGEGEYHGERSLMSAETGKRALDFVVKNSGSRVNLEVDFFGGEPTINFETVRQVVFYGRELEKLHNKKFRFTLTTNAFALTDEIIDFTVHNMSNIVMSLDGRKETNDRMRPDRAGNGSYESIVPKIKKLVDLRGGKDYYVRGTFTRNNLDFSKDVVHLYELGFNQISIEPVVAPADKDYALTMTDIPLLCAEYEKLTDIMQKNKDLSFFHFNLDLTGGSCALKRISGCGAGCEYVSVTPDGDIYPCHQFTGLEDFKIGNVSKGIKNKALSSEFAKLNIYTKQHCADCWAKFYCGGGCAANSHLYGGSIFSAYEIGCLLQKKRIECAIYIMAVRSGDFVVDESL